MSQLAAGRRVLAVAALSAMAAVGCGATDQVVAREVEAGPAPVEAGTPCTTSSECGPQDATEGGAPLMFCSMESCVATVGTCQPRETNADTAFSRDHIVPISKGGSNSIENIQPLC